MCRKKVHNTVVNKIHNTVVKRLAENKISSGNKVIVCSERGLIFLFDKSVSRYTFSTFPVGEGGG